jgi:hypothetical protein
VPERERHAGLDLRPGPPLGTADGPDEPQQSGRPCLRAVTGSRSVMAWTAMTAAPPPLSERAQAIVDGLVRTRRGSKPHFAGDYVQLRAKAGGFYFVACDGTHVLRGYSLAEAEELQAKFAEAMAKAGKRPPGRQP